MNLRLGIQGAGEAIVALTGDLASPDLAPGHLPATASCRVAKAQGLLYRVPRGSVRHPSSISIVSRDGIFVHDDGEVELDGGEIAELPVSWIAWLETANAELDVHISPRDVFPAKRDRGDWGSS